MKPIAKRFRMAGREGAAILDSLRAFIATELLLYREVNFSQKKGGRSGDLGEEAVEYEVYFHGGEAGWNSGTVHVYSLVDHNTNGYAHLLSVLVNLPEDATEKKKLLASLEYAEFVSSHSSFKERPMGHKTFRPYMDDIPNLACLEQQFRLEARTPCLVS